MDDRDRHYFNDEGDCIACSEFQGPWPDDDHECDNKCDEEHRPAEEYTGAVVIDRPSTSAKSVSEVALRPSLEHSTI
jgi:hypothetical protein